MKMVMMKRCLQCDDEQEEDAKVEEEPQTIIIIDEFDDEEVDIVTTKKKKKKKKQKKTSCLDFHHHNNNNNNNNNNSMVDNDVILEILVQLPPISVIRFKLVSKTWYALISHSNFLLRHSLHYHHHIQQTGHIDRLSDGLHFGPMGGRRRRRGDGHTSRLYSHPFQHQLEYLIFPPPPTPTPPPPPPPILRILYQDNHPLAFFPINADHLPMPNFSFFILSSFSNGLLIFRGDEDIYYRDNSTYFLCNPVLKQYIELPKIEYTNAPYDSEYNSQEDCEYELVVPLEPPYTSEPIIVFDPTISLSYKVFLVRRVHDSDWIDTSLQIYAYSSSSSAWRLITILPDWDHSLDSGNGVLLNGVLYHLCSNEVIICIHVTKEIVWVLDCPSLPIEITPSYRYQYFGECGGHLQLVAQYYDTTTATTFSFPCSLDVFEMEQPQQQQHGDDDQEEVVHSAVWILKYRVRNIRPQPYYDHILREHSIHIIRLFKTGGRGEEEEEALLMKIFPKPGGDGMMLIFNLTSNTFGELLDIPFDCVHDSYSDVFPYTMTLFPLSSYSS